MSDSILAKAEADLARELDREADYRRKAAEAAGRAEKLETFISMYRDYSGSGEHPNIMSDRGGLRSASGAMSQTATAATEIIERYGRPLQTTELLPLLEAAGVEISGKDKIANLSARLSRSEGLVNIRQRGWWIKGQDDSDDAGKLALSSSVEDQDDDLIEPQA